MNDPRNALLRFVIYFIDSNYLNTFVTGKIIIHIIHRFPVKLVSSFNATV